ncbi:unnamed protein product [Protopolystoma xenopodis]|uniref:Uncharacterized protein n=1 Tax=Protopolystoma xenopodis TaxID=117903 RepID=A0A3S5FC31_9PLAT|nr:unnamed protein product [Protopolystoma xenopodis]
MMSVISRTKTQRVFTGIEGDCLGNSVSMNVPVKPIDSWSSRRLPRKQRQHECSSKANRQLVKRTQIASETASA